MKTSSIVAISPGHENSALLIWDGRSVRDARYAPNREILAYLYQRKVALPVVVEKISSCHTTAAIAPEVFEAVYWSGRFAEAAGESIDRIPRLDVKIHVCNDALEDDANVCQAILDRFGGVMKAIGTISSPGPLGGVHGELWMALAIAITWWDRHPEAQVGRGGVIGIDWQEAAR